MSIDAILTTDQLRRLRDQYDAEEMNGLLAAPLPAVYPPALPYVHAIRELFYGGSTADMATSRLSAENRERCLLAILATRGPGLNLALHVYLALVSGVSPMEIAHIFLLTGAYSGVDTFAAALQTEAKTLEVLRRKVSEGVARAADVYGALVEAFRG